MIYFVQSGDDGPIKIGLAKDINKRMRGLQTAHPFPLRLIASFDGDRTKEKALHQELKSARLEGEWFAPDAALAIIPRFHEIEFRPETKPEKPLPVGVDARIIVALGNTTTVAKKLGVTEQQVSNWKSRGISWRYRGAILKLARRQRLTLPSAFLLPS